MAHIQKQFEQFNDSIKLHRFKENATLVEKRDRILRTINDGIARLRQGGTEIPSYRTFNQGSYEIDVGTNPPNGDFDIDVGLAFDLIHGEHDPVAAKSWILDAVDGHTKSVRMRTSCVTVFYQSAGEHLYHVDVSVYADADKNGGRLHLARGKPGSLPASRSWTPSDPEGLTTLINDRFTGADAKQFRRVIRALKRWKDERFKADGNEAPRGIAIAVAAYLWFSPATRFIDGESRPDDLNAIRNLVAALLRAFSPRAVVRCPAEPFDDLCARMTDIQMGQFKTRLESLLAALKAAEEDTDPRSACQTLAREFGEDFPVPDPKDTAKPQRRAITSSGSSA